MDKSNIKSAKETKKVEIEIISKNEKKSTHTQFENLGQEIIDARIIAENQLDEMLTEGICAPEAKQEINLLKEQAIAATESIFHKISSQLGSNEGGWYEKKDTGEKYYIKFYDNPDQARVEFIANSIYKRLGINAVKSELLEIGNKLAVVSKEVLGAEGVSKKVLQHSSDVRNGFVADAYLANWDVVGLSYDNIVRGIDGNMYRVDNGGSLIFRAQGATKDFLPNNIPELDNMLNEYFTSGQVFCGLTEDELKHQAQKLIEDLNEKDIKIILDESGLSGEIAENIYRSLLGRRQYLIERFGLISPLENKHKRQGATERISIVNEKLNKRIGESREIELSPRVGILVDFNKIENQQIDIIKDLDSGTIRVNFKLTEGHYQIIKAKCTRQDSKDLGWEDSQIIYGRPSENEFFDFVECWQKNIDGALVKISRGINQGSNMRTALGLVEIVLNDGDQLTDEQIGEKINTILIKELDISSGLDAPDFLAEKEYKQARYKWHHKETELPEGIENRLMRQEVCPDYFTFVEKDKYKEYQDIAPYAVYHSICDPAMLPRIIKSGGLLSTHERYRRGLIKDGMSSVGDMKTGGGDSVFTRIVTRDGAAKVINKKMMSPLF